MSYESSRSYREYALIEGINMLVNMVNQTKDDKVTLKQVHTTWIESSVLSFGDQIELIWGTAADGIRCRYMAFCINQLNSYMMSKHPNHIEYIKSLTNDILNSINMAIFGNAHIWSTVQLESIKAAFRSGRMAKARPYYEPPEEDDEKYIGYKKQRVLEYNPNGV